MVPPCARGRRQNQRLKRSSVREGTLSGWCVMQCPVPSDDHTDSSIGTVLSVTLPSSLWFSNPPILPACFNPAAIFPPTRYPGLTMGAYERVSSPGATAATALWRNFVYVDPWNL